MSLFNDLINGDGRKGFRWSITAFKGDEDFQYFGYFTTYEVALAERLRLNLNEDFDEVLCELWYRNNSPEDLIGDDSDWELLQKNLEKVCPFENDFVSL